jgi:hypothetical protein
MACLLLLRSFDRYASNCEGQRVSLGQVIAYVAQLVANPARIFISQFQIDRKSIGGACRSIHILL